MKAYTENFYKSRHKKTHHAAETVLTSVLELMPNIKTAVDVGCGVGTWLSVLKKKGVVDIQGIDGNWLNKRSLEIPPECFIEHDLSKKLEITKRFDLAISLEVAEHLPKERASSFVTSLTRLSDFVLFSAAIPYQTGKNHINEQWPEYWADLFAERGYIVLDFIRNQIWDDEEIPTWYRQNILFFVKEEKISLLNQPTHITLSSPLSIVHPDAYLTKVSTVKGSWKLFREAIKKSIKKRVRGKS